VAASPHLAPILRAAQLRTLERAHAHEALMERAGEAAAQVAQQMAQPGKPIVVLAGPGNNGGDAFVVARRLRSAFFDVRVVFRGDASRLPSDAANAFAAMTAGGLAVDATLPNARPGLIVDGLFGIGLARPLAREYAELVRWSNAQGAPTLALDVPSGLDAETGNAQDPSVRATATSTFIALKPGLLTGDGPDLCGKVRVHALELDADACATGHWLRWSALAEALPCCLSRTRHNVHKGTFGTLGVVGGASGMTGATILAGRAALRLGAGRVRIGMLAQDRLPYDPIMPELMIGTPEWALAHADAAVVGPGLGLDEPARALLAAAVGSSMPLLLDADALNLVANDAPLQSALRDRGAETILTPHPTEAARLLACSTEEVQRDRLSAALSLAQRFGACVVVKGAGSVLAYSDATFDINATGNAALSTAGSGDVLSGMAGAFLAQGIDAPQALRFAVCLHGAAADRLVADGHGPLGVVASELPDAARMLVNRAARASPEATSGQ